MNATSATSGPNTMHQPATVLRKWCESEKPMEPPCRSTNGLMLRRRYTECVQIVTSRNGACRRSAGGQPARLPAAMADQKDLEFTYSLIDRIFRLSLGELADFSGAKYDGDFSLTLEEAQHRKHQYVAQQIGIKPGTKVLDLGCGWGPLLNFIRSQKANGTGVTLSTAQQQACRKHGLDVHIRDARQVTRDTFGPFDAVASLGAWEHFCSPDEHRAGKQDEIYEQIFENVATT